MDRVDGRSARVAARLGRTLGVVLAAASAATSFPARADGDAGAGEEIHRVAVVDVRSVGRVDPEYVAGLSAVIGGLAAASDRLDVVMPADIREMLDFEAQRQILGCEDDTACLAEIAGALGVRYLLTSEVSRFGDSWLLSMTLIDMDTGRTGRRATARAPTEDLLLEEVGPSLAEVFTLLTGDETVDAWARASARAPRGESRDWLRLSSTAALVGGTASVVGGGVLYVRGWTWRGRVIEATAQDHALLTHSDARRIEAWSDVGLGLMAGGTLIAAGGFLLPRIREARASVPAAPADVDLAVHPLPDGGIFVSGSLRW